LDRPLYLTLHAPHPHLHSLPTRRSSDLAGNKGIYGKVDFPARYPETIAVTATDKRGQIAAFSNHSRDVDVAAPGEKIPSSWTNRSEEHTSELQSREISYAVFCLKKKKSL